MWDQGSKGWDRGLEGWDLEPQATQSCHAFVIKDQKVGCKNGISDEKIYLVMYLC